MRTKKQEIVQEQVEEQSNIVDIDNDTKLTKEQAIVQRYLKMKYPNLTEQQLQDAIYFALLNHLDPRKDEAYIIPYGNKVQLVVNYKVILQRAMRNPNYYRYSIHYFLNGKELVGYPITEKLVNDLAVVVNIYDRQNNLLSNTQFTPVALYKTNQGTFKNNFQLWVQKNALVNAFRTTFPNEIADLHIEEEFTYLEPTPAQNMQYEQYTKPSDAYKQIVAHLDNTYQNDNASRIATLKAFLTTHNATKNDLVNGKFSLEEFKKWEDDFYAESVVNGDEH